VKPFSGQGPDPKWEVFAKIGAVPSGLKKRFPPRDDFFFSAPCHGAAKLFTRFAITALDEKKRGVGEWRTAGGSGPAEGGCQSCQKGAGVKKTFLDQVSCPWSESPRRLFNKKPPRPDEKGGVRVVLKTWGIRWADPRCSVRGGERSPFKRSCLLPRPRITLAVRGLCAPRMRKIHGGVPAFASLTKK